MNYLVSDVIIRLKNAAMAHRKQAYLPMAKMSKAIAAVLLKEKYILSVKEQIVEKRNMLAVEIAYDNHRALFSDVKVVSKPSLRVYAGEKQVRGKGLGVTVVSTNQGVMTGKEAQEKKIGGEVLFKIW